MIGDDPASGEKSLRFRTTHHQSPKIEVHKIERLASATTTVKSKRQQEEKCFPSGGTEEVACSLESSLGLARKRS